jgi:erythromycin esterase-like protein
MYYRSNSERVEELKATIARFAKYVSENESYLAQYPNNKATQDLVASQKAVIDKCSNALKVLA